MNGSSADGLGKASQSLVSEVLAELVEALRPEFVTAVDNALGMMKEIPEFAGLPVDDPGFRSMGEGSFDATCALLASPTGTAVEVPSEVTRAFAREAFGEGISAEALVRAYSHGLRAVLAWWRDRIQNGVTDPDLRMLVLDRINDAFFSYAHAVLRVTVEEYAEASAASLRGLAERRMRVVRGILDGTEVAGESVLSQRLGYDLSARHIGIVLWSAIAENDESVYLETLCRRWLARLGVEHPLLLSVDGRTFWAWQGSFGPAGLPEVLPMPESPLRAAIGQPARGLRGFQVTHLEAVAARRTAEKLGSDARLVRHADVETLSVISEDVTALRRYVRHKLGRLGEDDIRSGELREALKAFLAVGGQVSQAASAIHVHRNTLARRVEQAAQLLGRPVDDDRIGIALALDIAEAYGARVLVAAP